MSSITVAGMLWWQYRQFYVALDQTDSDAALSLERVRAEHGVPAVAIFWIDAEDHDWDEVRSCTVFDSALAPHDVSLPPRPGGSQVPVAGVTLDDMARVGERLFKGKDLVVAVAGRPVGM